MDDVNQDKYFFDDGSVKWDEIPHPEDLWAENEYELVGLWIRMTVKLNQMSNQITALTVKLPLPLPPEQHTAIGEMVASTEGRLESWVESAKDYLPEWVNVDGIEASSYIPFKLE